MILELGQEICKISLEYLVVSENKEVPKNKNKNNPHYNNGSMSKGHRSQLKEFPMAKVVTI